MSILSLCLLLPTTLALPHFWPHGHREKPYPTLTISSSDGIYPTGVAGTTGTGTGTGTAYYPTGTGTAYYPTATGTAFIAKRDPVHPFGYPPPYKPSLSSDVVPTGLPTASAPPILSTYFPTGTAPSASGTGTALAYPTYIPDEGEIDAAKQAHRQHFEGPRKRHLRPYYPYNPNHSYDGAGPRATAPTGATGTGGIPFPIPTGTSVVPWPVPTGTGVVPLPVPTGGSSSVVVPLPSGTIGGRYPAFSP